MAPFVRISQKHPCWRCFRSLGEERTRNVALPPQAGEICPFGDTLGRQDGYPEKSRDVRSRDIFPIPFLRQNEGETIEYSRRTIFSGVRNLSYKFCLRQWQVEIFHEFIHLIHSAQTGNPKFEYRNSKQIVLSSAALRNWNGGMLECWSNGLIGR
jgi:hypothetical protein